jgi:hypothetical protein
MNQATSNPRKPIDDFPDALVSPSLKLLKIAKKGMTAAWKGSLLGECAEALCDAGYISIVHRSIKAIIIREARR